MKKIYNLFLLMIALLGVSSASAQVIVGNLPNCDTGGVGYYYVINHYDQLPEGEEWALTLTEDYDVVVQPLDRSSRQQIFRVVATTNNGNPTTGGGSPRYRFYSCDKEDVIHGLQGTENNDMELLHGTTYITSAGTESNVAMCSMRNQGVGYTIAMNNRTGKLIVPQNFTAGAPVYMTGGVMDNANNTCQVWTFEAISAEMLAELDPEAAEDFYKDQVISLYTSLSNIGGQDESGLPHLTGGTMFGFYPLETADLYNQVMAKVFSRIDVAEQEELIELYNELTALQAKIDEGVIEVTDGYYYLISAYDRLNALGTDPDAEKVELAAYPLTNEIGWTTDDPNFRDGAQYVWKFAKREDGKWDITNFQTAEAFAAWNGANRIATTTTMDITVDDQTNQRKAYKPFGIVYNGLGGVAICLDGNTGQKFYPRNAGMMFGENVSDEHKLECGDRDRGFSNSTGRYWYLESVPEEKVEALREAAENEAKAVAFAQKLQDEILNAKTSVLAAYTLDMTDQRDVTPTDQMAFNSNSGQNCDHGNTWDEENGVCTYGTEGYGYAGLIDGDQGSYFHTASGAQYPVLDDEGNPGQPWLSAELPEAVSNITFAFYCRNNQNDWATPSAIAVDVSEDGITWKEVSKPYAFYDAETYEKNSPTYAGPFELGGEYKFIRFRSFATRRHSGNNNFFCLGDIKYLTGVKLAAGAQAATMPQELVQALSDALGFAVAEQKDNTYANWEDLTKASADLAAALAAFKTAFVDPTKLEAILPEARVYVQNFSTDEQYVGTYTDDAQADYDALKAAVDKYDGIMDGSDPTLFTVELIDELIETIQTSEENMAQKIRMPETDKWYQIYFGSEDEWADLGWDVLEPRNLAGRNDAMVDAEDNIETVWNLYDRKMAICTDYEMSEEFDPEYIKDLRFFSVSEEGLEANDEALSYFRFIPVGENGLYAIQNKATGLYVGPAAGTNGDIVPSVVPGLFSVKNAGPGFVTLRSHNFQDEAEHQNTIHFRRSEYGIVAYTDGVNNQGANTKSALHVKAVNETVSDEVSIFIPAEDTETVMAYALPGGVKKVNSESTLYKVTGRFEEDEVTYVALEEVESVEPGAPFLITGEYYAEIVSSDDLAQTPVKENGITGTYAQYTAQNGNLVLDLLTDMYYVEGDDYPHSYWDDLELNLFNQFSVVNAYDLVTNKNINAGGAYIVNIDELPIVEPTEMSVLILQANINSDFLPVGVKSVKADMADADITAKAVFNMAGQRVGTIADLKSLKKGIYIVNGRKVLVK